MLQNQTISTMAFLAGAAAIGLYIFKVIPVKQALMIGAAGIVVGMITQPPAATT